MGIKVKKDCRLIMDLKRMGIDCIEEFGRYNYVSTQEKLDMHRHPNCIEICYLSKGTQEYILDTDVFLLNGGEIFLTFPNEYQGSGEFPEEKGCLYWLILHRPTPGKNFLGLDFEEAEQLFSIVLSIQKRLFKGCLEYEKILLNITKLCEKKTPTALDQIEVKNQITRLLILTTSPFVNWQKNAIFQNLDSNIRSRASQASHLLNISSDRKSRRLKKNS